MTHSSSTGDSGRPRSRLTRCACSADSWIGVSGFLMSCATWRAMSAHASSRCVRSSSLPLPLQIGGHLVEVLDQPPQFVRRGGGDARVEIAARDAPRRARQPVHRIGDPLGHPVAERGAEQAEEHEAGQHATIELVDLLLDLLLPVRHRHGDDAFAAAGAHRRRRQLVGKIADLLLADVGRQSVEQDRAIDVARRARRQQLRREQIACARRLQARAIEQVHVLVDRAPNQHHDLIVDSVERRRRRAAAAPRSPRPGAAPWSPPWRPLPPRRRSAASRRRSG